VWKYMIQHLKNCWIVDIHSVFITATPYSTILSLGPEMTSFVSSPSIPGNRSRPKKNADQGPPRARARLGGLRLHGTRHGWPHAAPLLQGR
jgi:hypothetical protein